MSVTLLIDETGGGAVDGGDCDGGTVDSTGEGWNSLMNAGLSRNRRCNALGRREDSALGLTAAEASGAAARPIEISGDGRTSNVGAIPVGVGWLIEEAEAPNCGELNEGTAEAGATGGEGGVGFLINVWGTTGWGLDWVWPGTRASFRAGEVSGGRWIKL